MALSLPLSQAALNDLVDWFIPAEIAGDREMRKQARMFLISHLFGPFLGNVVPLALFLVFVIWPFGQAVYYALTDWTGFQADYNFIGLDNFSKLWDDEIFRKAVKNNILLAIVVPFVTISIALTFG